MVPRDPRAYVQRGDVMWDYDKPEARSNYFAALSIMGTIHRNERTISNYYYAMLAEDRVIKGGFVIEPVYAMEASKVLSERQFGLIQSKILNNK